MNRRCFARLFARGAFAALILVLSAVLVAPSWAQTEESMPPRTSWGDPDIGGIWNNSTLTPLERPEDQADKEFLSPDEAGALERQVVERNNRANEPSVVRTEPLPVGGNVGGYNNFWMERGTKAVPTRRTSLIIDPPDGRLPPLTPDAERRITSPELARLDDVRQGRVRPTRITNSTWAIGAFGTEGSRHSRPVTTTTITSFRRRSTSPFSRSTSTTSVSSHWMAVRIPMRASVSTGAIRAATGRVRALLSKRRISATGLSFDASIWTSPRPCTWSSASRASGLMRLTISSRSTIRTSGRDRGRARCRWLGAPGRCLSTRATRATTG